MKKQDDMNIGCIHRSNNCGDLEIVGYKNSYSVSAKFVNDDTVVVTSANHIRNGRVKNPNHPSVCGVGFIGVGNYSPKIDRKAYEKWISMMRRCYATESNKNFKTYAKVFVCDEWHNFQNFAKWFDMNYPKDGESYDLDKDYLSQNEKIYSPRTCRFISHQENIEISHAKSFAFKSPGGDVVTGFNLRKLCRDNNLNSGEMSRVLNRKALQHKGWRLPVEIEVEV